MAVEAGILPSVTLQKGGGGSAASRVTSIIGASVVTAAERTTAVTNLISNVSINATTALRLSAAARGSFGITNVPGAVTTIPITIPITIPGAPTGLVATPSNQSLFIAFSINSGGSAIINYSYSMDGITYTEFSPAQTSSPVSITGLTNGTSYTVYLKATNSIGTGPASASVTATANISVPGAPTDLVATGGNRTLSVAFSINNGGSAITNYSYSITGVGGTYIAFSPAQTSSPVTITTTNGITALTNGTNYTVYLKAINAIGTGAASDPVIATPFTVPNSPSGLSVIPGDQSLFINFSAGNNGGSPITNYSYSINGANGTYILLNTTSSPLTITGLTNGTTYTIHLKAINAAGSSITPTLTNGRPSTVASPPINIVATPSNQSIIINFTTVNNSSSAISNYSYSIDGTTYIPLNPADASSPVTISGLTNGITYTVYLKSINAVGSSAASSPVTATPAPLASAPTILSVTATPTSFTSSYIITNLSISFTAPTNNGGTAITNYSYSIDGTTYTPFSPAQTTSPFTISNVSLTNTFIYIRAINGWGEGDRSTQYFYSNPVSIYNTPGLINIAGITPAITIGDIYLFISDSGANKIWRFGYTTNNQLIFLAGSGTNGYADGTGAAASFSDLRGIASGSWSGTETLFVCEYAGQRIRRITMNGDVSTFGASYGIPAANYISATRHTNSWAYIADGGTSGNNGKLINATLTQQNNNGTVTYYSTDMGVTGISGVAMDSTGAIFSCKTSANTVYKNGVFFATVISPINITIDTDNNNNVVYVSSTANNNIYKITSVGVVSIVSITLPGPSANLYVEYSGLYIGVGSTLARINRIYI
jgi:titin